jgi:hypothetical protein
MAPQALKTLEEENNPCLQWSFTPPSPIFISANVCNYEGLTGKLC